MHNKESLLAVTVAIPVKNEEVNLDLCLRRLSRFAEVVVIDSASTDRTREIAQKFGVRIVDFVWDGKFPKKRNWFLLNEMPTQPWVLFLDADEFVDDRFCDALADSLSGGRADAYWLNYSNWFLGRKLNHGVPQQKLALFRVGAGLYERIDEDRWSCLDMEVHEHPIIRGNTGIIGVPIEHRDYKGLAQFLDKHRSYAMWEARRYALLARSPEDWNHLTRRQKLKYRNIDKAWYPWFYFIFSYFFRAGFLDGSAGFNYAIYKAWYFQTVRLIIQEREKVSE
ncbi:glycosyltransferase family 2 protein [Mesorhizobium sp. 10J20-29]